MLSKVQCCIFTSVKFKCQTKHVMKMVHFTTAQRVKIVKTYYKNGDSKVFTCFRALNGGYCAHNRPTTQKIANILKEFKENGSVTGTVEPVRHLFRSLYLKYHCGK